MKRGWSNYVERFFKVCCDKLRKWQFQWLGGYRILIRKANKITGCEEMKTVDDTFKIFYYEQKQRNVEKLGSTCGIKGSFCCFVLFCKMKRALEALYILIRMIYKRKRKMMIQKSGVIVRASCYLAEVEISRRNEVMNEKLKVKGSSQLLKTERVG